MPFVLATENILAVGADETEALANAALTMTPEEIAEATKHTATRRLIDAVAQYGADEVSWSLATPTADLHWGRETYRRAVTGVGRAISTLEIVQSNALTNGTVLAWLTLQENTAAQASPDGPTIVTEWRQAGGARDVILAELIEAAQ